VRLNLGRSDEAKAIGEDLAASLTVRDGSRTREDVALVTERAVLVRELAGGARTRDVVDMLALPMSRDDCRILYCCCVCVSG